MVKRSRLFRVKKAGKTTRLRGLSKPQIKEWFEVNEMIEVDDVFGVIDMRIRAKLEGMMSPAQAEILENAVTAIEDYGVSPKKAYKTAFGQMLRLVS